MWILAVVFAVAFLISLREPRRMRCAVFLLASLLSLIFFVLNAVGEHTLTNKLSLYSIVALFILSILVVVVLGVVLILNGFTMIRKEGRRLSNLLGLFLGLLMVGYVAMSGVAIVAHNDKFLLWLFFLGFPLAYLGFGFTAYLLYSWLYLFVTKRWAKPPDAVIVLGSGLVKNKVTPLLASRLDESMMLAARTDEPVFIVSGGKGTDEQRSEASAMEEYLVGSGIPDDLIITEDLSRTTRENIVNTKAILAEKGITGPVAAVTNNFHAFRAALLLRREKVPGYAVGAPTARYYWPAATIREYVAILRDSLPFTVICLVVSVIPLLSLTIRMVVQ